MKQLSIGRDKAIALGKSEWWKGRTHFQIAKFQLGTEEICTPFQVFHAALEKSLKRPVWTHEIALNLDGLWMELTGEKDTPTWNQIIALIPEEKRILVQL